MHKATHHFLTQKTQELRKEILKSIHEAGSGHPGGSLSIIDVLTVLYYNHLHHNPDNPQWSQRDRLILSAGHLCPALYTTLADQGYYPKADLMNLRKFGSKLQGHPENGKLPGIENTSGPLGQGYVYGVGKAIAAKRAGKDYRTFVITTDGEHDEGAVWEAAQLAAHHKLNNLCVIIDRNNVQIDGYTEEELSLGNLKNKYKTFGFKTIDIDGHNIHMINDALTYYDHHKLTQPFCIIAHTTLGKGVSYMQNNPIWHGKAPNEKELAAAIEELDKRQRQHQLKHHLKKKKVLK